MEAAVFVIAAAHVIEAVRELVPHHRAHRPVVARGRVGSGEEGALQQPGGEEHAVHLPRV